MLISLVVITGRPIGRVELGTNVYTLCLGHLADVKDGREEIMAVATTGLILCLWALVDDNDCREGKMAVNTNV